MDILRIGEGIEVTENFDIKTYFSNRIFSVKKGDKGFINNNGSIHYLTGEVKGKIQKLDYVKIEGFDIENISNLILSKLDEHFNLKNILKEKNIDNKDFKHEIVIVLSKILQARKK